MMLTTRRLFVAFLFIALFMMATREIADPDFWWHLSTGQYILETHSIPQTDVFSFTNAGRPWVTHEWLSQVSIYTLFALGSFPALIIAFAAIITLSFAFVYVRSEGKPYVAAFALLLAALATAPTWGVRPQMISLLLTSIFLYVLHQWQTCLAEQSEARSLRSAQGEKRIWVLLPLMILWVNLHSGYALGPAIIAVYLLGETVSQFAIRHSISAIRHSPLVTLALVFVACLLVVPLNPNGATMYIYPFETLTSRTMQAYIQEWFSPDFHLIQFQPFAWLLLGTLTAIGFSGKRVSLTQMLLLAGFGYAALRSARQIPIFAIMAAPILAEHLWHIVKSRGWASALSASPRTSRAMVFVNWLLLLMILAAGLARVAVVVSNQSTVERARFPAAAVEFLQTQKISGALYNAYGWGGYLMWRMYPEKRVFIDGRADVYGDTFIENVYLKAYRGGADWREPLDGYNVRVVLIEPDAPLATQLARDTTWKRIYEDKQAVVFQRQ